MDGAARFRRHDRRAGLGDLLGLSLSVCFVAAARPLQAASGVLGVSRMDPESRSRIEHNTLTTMTMTRSVFCTAVAMAMAIATGKATTNSSNSNNCCKDAKAKLMMVS